MQKFHLKKGYPYQICRDLFHWLVITMLLNLTDWMRSHELLVPSLSLSSFLSWEGFWKQMETHPTSLLNFNYFLWPRKKLNYLLYFFVVFLKSALIIVTPTLYSSYGEKKAICQKYNELWLVNGLPFEQVWRWDCKVYMKLLCNRLVFDHH